MALNNNNNHNVVFIFSLLLGLAASTAWVYAAYTPFISDAIFESQTTSGRSLLQQKKSCDVNFETLDYKVITNQCKGPQYPAKLCCKGFKEFACPHLDKINDLNTDCASTMFSYINLYGKYPPGLFASECREGKEGLNCTGFETAPQSYIAKSSGFVARSLSPYLLALASLLLLFHMF